MVGIIIAGLVLLPEGLGAYRAAQLDRLQTSTNLALGSALASIGLTVPAVAVVSILFGQLLQLELGPKESVLLALTLLVAVITLGTGRTTVLQGVVHLSVFAASCAMRSCLTRLPSFTADGADARRRLSRVAFSKNRRVACRSAALSHGRIEGLKFGRTVYMNQRP